MNNIINLEINKNHITDYKSGYPLISTNTVNGVESIKEGTIVNLCDSKNNFISKGYIGKQNKGYGWVLTQNIDEEIDTIFFQRKFLAAIEYRKEFYSDQSTTAFRVFNDTGDGIGGISIDYFDGYYMITWYSLGIYQFKQQIIEALENVVEYKAIYEKKRFNQNGQYLDDETDFVSGTKGNFPIIVKENNINFAVYLDDGPMTGIFLDQRDVRDNILQKYAKDKIVLNTFSYTGAFSVASALGGAKKTTSVDLANRSLTKTREQFTINNIDPNSQNIVVQDVFLYFKYALKKKMLFDMVIVDPPSFARSKKNTFSVAKDYVKLLKEIILITKNGGTIVASTNYANLNMRRFRDFIDKAFKELKIKYQINEVFTLPKDFKVSKNFLEGNYLKVIFIKKIK